MMRSEGTKIIMDEYDYGLPFGIRFTSNNVDLSDKIVFVIKKDKNDEAALVKVDNIPLVEEDGVPVFNLSFTEEQSEVLPAGEYIYLLQQCRDCKLHNTIINGEPFIVNRGHNL